MPADHGVRFDYDEGVFPTGPEPEQSYPENAIEWRELGLRFLLAVCGELLTKSQFDNHWLIVASEKGRGAASYECQKVE